MPLTTVPVHLTPTSSDICVPTVAAPTLRSTVTHVTSVHCLTQYLPLLCTVSYMLNQSLTPSKLTNNSYFIVLCLVFCYIMRALEYTRTSKTLSRLEKALKYYNKSWPKKSPQVEWGWGPFDIIPFPTVRVSTMGLVPTKDRDARLIHHLCYPDCDSLITFSTLTYVMLIIEVLTKQYL